MKEVNKVDNPAAFPMCDTEFNTVQEGMSLRDYFAGQALQGWFSSHANPNAGSPISQPNSFEGGANGCYEIADAMLKARNNG